MPHPLWGPQFQKPAGTAQAPQTPILRCGNMRGQALLGGNCHQMAPTDHEAGPCPPRCPPRGPTGNPWPPGAADGSRPGAAAGQRPSRPQTSHSLQRLGAEGRSRTTAGRDGVADPGMLRLAAWPPLGRWSIPSWFCCSRSTARRLWSIQAGYQGTGGSLGGWGDMHHWAPR